MILHVCVRKDVREREGSDIARLCEKGRQGEGGV